MSNEERAAYVIHTRGVPFSNEEYWDATIELKNQGLTKIMRTVEWSDDIINTVLSAQMIWVYMRSDSERKTGIWYRAYTRAGLMYQSTKLQFKIDATWFLQGLPLRFCRLFLGPVLFLAFHVDPLSHAPNNNNISFSE